MRKPFVADALRPVLVAGAMLAAASAQAKDLRFDEAFATPRAASAHYEARFTGSDGRETTVEAWRDGEARVRRITGGAVEILAQHPPGAAEYDMTVLDRRRRLVTTIDRTSLYRLGNFTDWFDLAHGLRHPKGAYRVTRASAPAGAGGHAVAACTWYDLEQQGRTNHVCWDARSQLPLAIVDAGGHTVWRVTRLEVGPVAPEAFEVDTRGFVALDANRDLERD